MPSASQQATKHGLGEQLVAVVTRKPWQTVPSGINVHVPSGRQQTCTGCGQLLGTHVLPGAGVVPGGQAEPTKKKHALPSQQARGHGLGLHVVAPVKMNPLH